MAQNGRIREATCSDFTVNSAGQHRNSAAWSASPCFCLSSSDSSLPLATHSLVLFSLVVRTCLFGDIITIPVSLALRYRGSVNLVKKLQTSSVLPNSGIRSTYNLLESVSRSHANTDWATSLSSQRPFTTQKISVDIPIVAVDWPIDSSSIEDFLNVTLIVPNRSEHGHNSSPG